MSISQKSLVISVLALSLASSQLNAMKRRNVFNATRFSVLRPDPASINPPAGSLSLQQTYHALSEQFISAAETDRIPMDLLEHIMQFHYHIDPIAFVQKLKGNEIEALFNQLEQESVFKMALRFGYAKMFLKNIPGDVLDDVVDFVQNYKNYGVNYGENGAEFRSTVLFSQPYLEHVLPLLELVIGEPVTMLDLSYNQLTALPESIGKLVNLERLYLHNNQLTALPESFDKLENLKELQLHNNQLTALSESIGNLVNLKGLSLSDNQLKELPKAIDKLENLKVLWLFNNQLTALPESIDKLVDLECLSLFNNQLTALPESFDKLENLKWLWLFNNQLTALPESFDKLENLQGLWLHDNQLNDETKGWLRRQFSDLGNKLIL